MYNQQLSSVNFKMYFFAREKGLEVGRAGKYKKEAQQARHLGEVCSQNSFFLLGGLKIILILPES